MKVPETASLVRLALRVKDIERMRSYYTGVLGLREIDRNGATVTLAPADQLFSLDLISDPSAPIRPYPCPGLYHFALVVPDRPALGAIFKRLIEISEPFEGMSDHLVSEALYIRDPEGNGIELYRDRPRSEWHFSDEGHLIMVSDPIDADGILASAHAASVLADATRFGHIHLHVRDLEAARTFFHEQLALNETAELPSALFFAAGDYHHHVGSNTWAPIRPVPEEATGLLSYTVRVGDDWTGPSELTDPVGATVLFERAA